MSLPPEKIIAIRRDPKAWFQGWGYWLDDENSRKPTRGPANVLQRRVFEHYRRCLAERKPCRMVVLKYRRAGSSTASTATLYTHALNFPGTRLGVIGTDYKASHNMLAMVKTFGRHDKFTGWDGRALREESFELVEWDDSGVKEIATRVEWPTGSAVELYTAKNPTSARSAGLSGYLATECAFWPADGVTSGAETLKAMRNTLPKKGFHVAIEESTANGAVGVHYETCLAAKWPDYADWWRKWEADWPLTPGQTEAERALQFTFIFAAWFEDDRNFFKLSPEEEKHVRETIDSDPRWIGEQELIDRYGQSGPKGLRLGAEVNATVWEQLIWRRAMIESTKGLENFKQEYPSNPLEAFRSTGTPVFDADGVSALDSGARGAVPEWGTLDEQGDGAVLWRRTHEREGLYAVWEQPKHGCRYLVIVDPMTGQEIATSGRAERDRHGILVLRDGFTDQRGVFWPPKVVARVKPPCQYDIGPMCALVARLSKYYGDCTVVVESNNSGASVIERLRVNHGCNLYRQQIPDASKLTLQTRLGWATNEWSRRDAITRGQDAIREQLLEVPCPHVRAELKTFVFDKRGHAAAQAGHHDDDVLALCIGLACLHAATTYQARERVPERRRGAVLHRKVK